jgi:hypothetical protein
MQMRHHPLFAGDDVAQQRVDLHTIHRGEAQAGQFRHIAQDRGDQIAEALIFPVPAGEVYGGQHHFAYARFGMGAHFGDYIGDGARTARAATGGDDAEGAGMVAAVLHGHKARVCWPEGIGKAGAGGTFQARASSLSALAIRPSISSAAMESRSTSTAQPVTISRASGRVRRALRIA